MKKFTSVLAVVLVIGASGIAMAAETTTQTVTYEVEAINELSVSADTASLTVNAAVAGSAPTAVSNTSTTYAITTNELSRKITGAINSDMPSGVTLTAMLASSGGTSGGVKTLTTGAADLVTNISTLNEAGQAITYELSATSAAGVVPSASKTVTLTITAGL